MHSTSKKLLYQLDHLVQVCNQPPLEPPTRKHVGCLCCCSGSSNSSSTESAAAGWEMIHSDIIPKQRWLFELSVANQSLLERTNKNLRHNVQKWNYELRNVQFHQIQMNNLSVAISNCQNFKRYILVKLCRSCRTIQHLAPDKCNHLTWLTCVEQLISCRH